MMRSGAAPLGEETTFLDYDPSGDKMKRSGASPLGEETTFSDYGLSGTK